MNRIDTAIRKRIEASIEEYEEVTRLTATATRRMLKDYSAIGMLEKLMESSTPQIGFKTLVSEGKSYATFEQIVLDFPDTFSLKAKDRASARLSSSNVNGGRK